MTCDCLPLTIEHRVRKNLWWLRYHFSGRLYVPCYQLGGATTHKEEEYGRVKHGRIMSSLKHVMEPTPPAVIQLTESEYYCLQFLRSSNGLRVGSGPRPLMLDRHAIEALCAKKITKHNSAFQQRLREACTDLLKALEETP